MKNTYNIKVYTSDDCAFCNSAKNLLKNKKLKFEEINISKNDKLKEEMIKKSNGLMTVPQIFVNSVHIGGFQELSNLESSKRLDKIIGK